MTGGPVPINVLLAEIESFRMSGYAPAIDIAVPGAGRLARPLPKSISDASRQPAAIGRGPASPMLGLQHELATVLREEPAHAVDGQAEFEGCASAFELNDRRRVDLYGNVLQKSEYPMTPAGFVIHHAVPGVRADVGCIMTDPAG